MLREGAKAPSLPSFNQQETENSMKLFELADDPETYGDQAGWWLVVSDDIEVEISGPYSTEEKAQIHLDLLVACNNVLDSWEKGDLAAAVRKLDAAIAKSGGRQ
jgi:hypothetical protein